MSNKYYQEQNVSIYTSATNEQINNIQQISNYSSNLNNYNCCDLNDGQQLINKNNDKSCSTNSYFCLDQVDNAAWLSDPKIFADIEKGLKLSDKIETIEITSKDLSPASCSSNVDLFFPDIYKSTIRDVCYFSKSNTINDSQQWLYCNGNSSNLNDLNCYNVQKNSNLKPETISNASNEQFFDQFLQKNYFAEDCNQATVLNNEYNNQIFYSTNPFDVINIEDDVSVNCSNDSSDIVVEESDEELVPDSLNEKISKNCQINTNCIICNCNLTPTGSQFFIITPETPLTMCSQTSVHRKLSEFIKISDNKHLCNLCLELVNVVDNLQWKLEKTKKELIEKYEKTCKLNGTVLNPNNKTIRKRKNAFKNLRFKCKKCKKIFSFTSFYWRHSCTRKKQKYLCDLCGRRTISYKKFERHLRYHEREKKIYNNSNNIRLFECKICKKLFRTKSKLKEHLNYCAGKFPFICKRENCDKKFATSTKLKQHVKKKHEKKFVAICSICNIGFVILSDYKTHMVSHSTEKKFNCNKCDKSYKTLSNLNFHMKSHNEKMPFNCEICNKGFMRKEYLESHVNNHNGVKNYTCAVCGKKFVSQKNLDAHIKHHDDENVKTKTCNICGKVLVSSYEDHLRTHMNLQEFECDFCNSKFNSKNTLSKHKRKKH